MKNRITSLFIGIALYSIASCSCRNQYLNLQTQDANTSPPELIVPKITRTGTPDGSTDSFILMSWNIQDLGRTKDSLAVLFIANVINEADIAAIQEVVAKDPAGAQTVAKIADELNRMGSKWDYSVSDPTKSPSAKISERYAFFWRTSEISFTKKARLDKTLENKCHREPYVGHFKTRKTGIPFQVVNFHSKPHKKNPENEIVHFGDYPQRLNSDKVIIAGDFNLNEEHMVWNDLYNQDYQPALREIKTTLKTKCKKGKYRNYVIDNIYYPSSINMLQSNSLDYILQCNNLELARDISDHLPVFMEFSIN